LIWSIYISWFYHWNYELVIKLMEFMNICSINKASDYDSVYQGIYSYLTMWAEWRFCWLNLADNEGKLLYMIIVFCWTWWIQVSFLPHCCFPHPGNVSECYFWISVAKLCYNGFYITIFQFFIAPFLVRFHLWRNSCSMFFHLLIIPLNY
jgi:hypothetical protein